ncbi:hypothetical protein ACHQM5_018650 [Ranunculus cassubicifolius]
MASTHHLLLLALIVTLLVASAAHCWAGEAESLLRWKHSLFGGSSSILSSWSYPPSNGHATNASSHCTSWLGVSCNENNRIVRLNLTNLGLSGTLQDFPFPFLSNLLDFDISLNALCGAIPVDVGNLSQIRYMDFSDNIFTGNIPQEIGKLTSLQLLHLSRNKLHGYLPLDIGNLFNLNELKISRNFLTGPLPSTIGNLTKLIRFYLYDNFFNGHLPEELTKLNLIELSVSSNNFTGQLPQSLCHNNLLINFTANTNHFTGPIPNNFKNCKSLFRVRLELNQLTGNISNVFGIYPHLNYIDLSYNKFYGKLSDNWSKCKNLSSLKISNNHIEGEIPPSLGTLSSLGLLDLSSNHLTGKIPIQLGMLGSLFKLNLSGNSLCGRLPAEISGISNLEVMDLSSNNLDELGPEVIINCAKLISLDLSKNKFYGRIPSQFGSMVSLQELLDLSHNMFIEEIPPELGNLKYLEKLNLSHNMLSGSIPLTFVEMVGLVSIDVSYNALEGPVPNNPLFHHIPIEAFSNNKGLCALPFEPCQFSKLRNGGGTGGHKTVEVLIIIIIISAVTFVLVFGVYFIFSKRSKRNSTAEASVNHDHEFFSVLNFDGSVVYENIIEATEGFDAKHCIGAGGNGNVYKAVLRTGQILAVKKIHSLQDCDLKLFSTEVRTLTELRHRNIVRLYGFCSHTLHTFLIYGYLDRGSLDKLLSNIEEACKFDWVKRICVLKGIANALAYMHHDCSPPLIHRDISSKNILLNLEYDACLGDFGIARRLNPDSSNWTVVAGTSGYLAPELAYRSKLNEKSDIYSFGVLTFEVITGSHPGEIISSLKSHTPEFILLMDILDKRLLPPTSEILKDIVIIAKLALSCLNVIPELRPTMESISRAISKCNSAHIVQEIEISRNAFSAHTQRV